MNTESKRVALGKGRGSSSHSFSIQSSPAGGKSGSSGKKVGGVCHGVRSSLYVRNDCVIFQSARYVESFGHLEGSVLTGLLRAGFVVEMTMCYQTDEATLSSLPQIAHEEREW